MWPPPCPLAHGLRQLPRRLPHVLQVPGLAPGGRGRHCRPLPVHHLQGDARCELEPLAGLQAGLLHTRGAHSCDAPALASPAAAERAVQLAAALSKAGFKPKDKLGIYSGGTQPHRTSVPPCGCPVLRQLHKRLDAACTDLPGWLTGPALAPAPPRCWCESCDA